MMVETARSALAATLARESACREAEPLDIQLAALRRLVEIAKGDSGQCSKVANFLLAWWNAAECGGFDLTDLWAVDSEIAKDILTVTGLVARRHDYPTAYALSLNTSLPCGARICWQATTTRSEVTKPI